MPSPIPPLPLPPRRRDPVAKVVRRLSGCGVHRSRPTRADLKRELRRQLHMPERGDSGALPDYVNRQLSCQVLAENAVLTDN